ncbi:MAG: TonB-dependent receptor [Gammaproteobacteria bacterium]|nr:TonB-dependent receptor [Gammaproteobacteria bacterium]
MNLDSPDTTPIRTLPAARARRTRVARTVRALLALGSASLALPAALAQDEAAGLLEEVTVTAQRTAERLQDVPLSVTAFSAESMERLQINSVLDLTRLTPNVKFDNVTGGTTGLKAYIRGGGITDGGTNTSESEVGVYVDDVYMARVSAAVIDFAEVERIEIMRGPQGVLYGRNTSAGAVNIITRGPTEEFQATSQVGWGTWNERRLKGFVSGPISADGRWRASLNGMIRGRDGGRQENVTTGKDVGEEDFYGAQGDLAFVGEAFSARLTLSHTDTDSDGQYAVNNLVTGTGANTVITPRTGSYYKVASPIPSLTKVKQTNAFLRLTWEFDGGRITSITGYSDLDDKWHEEFSGGVPSSALGIPGNTTLALFDRDSVTTQDQLSEELQISGAAFDGKLEYLGGLYYFTEDSIQTIRDVIFFAPSSVVFSPDTTSKAVFGQLTWNFNDQWSAIAGGRYTEDDKHLDAILSGTVLAPVDNQYSKFTPKVGVNYKITPSILLFASYSEGFKSGGYNGLASTAVQVRTAFQPQYTDAWEAGIKADLLGNTLRVNVSAFKNEISNRQQTLTLPNGTFLVENYNADLKGLEAEVTWRATDALSLWTSVSINDGKYTAGGSSAGALGSIINNKLPVFPDYTATAGVDYSLQVGNGTLRFGGDYNVRDGYFSTADNARIGAVEKQDFLSAYVGYDIGKWSLQLAGRNLLDEEGWQTGFGFSVVQPRFAIDPRTVLATARYTF